MFRAKQKKFPDRVPKILCFWAWDWCEVTPSLAFNLWLLKSNRLIIGLNWMFVVFLRYCFRKKASGHNGCWGKGIKMWDPILKSGAETGKQKGGRGTSYLKTFNEWKQTHSVCGLNTCIAVVTHERVIKHNTIIRVTTFSQNLSAATVRTHQTWCCRLSLHACPPGSGQKGRV